MSLPIVIRPEAQSDLLATRDWYDQQRLGLGDEFSAAVAVNIERLAAMPRLCQVLWEDVRASRLRKFPYIIYYRALSDRVEVLAVLHGSRNSSAWKARS
jgi:plasmid stabilization system protein ParE